ncbi:MAG: ATP-grasp domain-containing protein [Bacteroidales bacterium]|nr:ATP-grasp domain-containing protein [Bacteroidales bacterium]
MKQKLLILGGNRLSCDIVEGAKSLGVYTIVTDWYDTDRSPAKLICDEYWTVSTTDYDELVRRIKEKHIDGILTGFSDSYLLPYQRLCELTGLPCYATKEQFEWSLDKKAFKEKCRKYNVPVVPEYAVEDFDKSIISKNHKVIIKPVDNSGSRGIGICDNPDDFDEKLKYSLGFSEKKVVVIEQYMECDDVSFEYKIQDGEVLLTAICDRYIYKTQNEGSITSKLVYPSKYTEAYLNDVDKRVKRMFEGEGLKNGVLFMQAFTDGDDFYFYEMGYRLSGGRHYIFTKNQNCESAVEELVRFAVTGEMSKERLSEITTPRFKNVCGQLSIICETDKIARIEGWEEVASLPQVIDALQTYKEGDEIGKQGTTASIFARLHIVAKDINELNLIIDNVYSTLKVRNNKGENIVIHCI